MSKAEVLIETSRPSLMAWMPLSTHVDVGRPSRGSSVLLSAVGTTANVPSRALTETKAIRTVIRGGEG